jgi:hypothetical protein
MKFESKLTNKFKIDFIFEKKKIAWYKILLQSKTYKILKYI